jgi:hypothetical protein
VISLRSPRLISLRPVSVDVSPSYAHIPVLFLLLFLSVLSHICLLDTCPSPFAQVGKWLVCHHMYWWLPPYCDSWSHFTLYYPPVVLQLFLFGSVWQWVSLVLVSCATALNFILHVACFLLIQLIYSWLFNIRFCRSELALWWWTFLLSSIFPGPFMNSTLPTLLRFLCYFYFSTCPFQQKLISI